MPSLTNLLIVCVVAFAAPFVLGLFPGVRLPSVILEIVAGIVDRPVACSASVEVDQAISVVALIGLTFVLFLAGLEIDFATAPRPGAPHRPGSGSRSRSALAVAVSFGLRAAGLVDTPLLVAIILCSTSLGVLVPVLKDAGEIASTFGQLDHRGRLDRRLRGDHPAHDLLLRRGRHRARRCCCSGRCSRSPRSCFVVVRGAERSARIRADLLRLQDTTAQIRVRARARAVRRLRGDRAAARARGDPRRVRRRARSCRSSTPTR